MRDQLGTRLELRLGDPVDSAHRPAARPPRCPQVPGRGLTADKLHFLAALPRIDGDVRPPITPPTAPQSLAAGRRDWAGAGRAAGADAAGRAARGAAAAGPRRPAGRARPGRGAAAAGVARLRGAAAPDRGRRQRERQDQPAAAASPTRWSPRYTAGGGAHHGRSTTGAQLFDGVPEEYRLGYAVSVDSHPRRRWRRRSPGLKRSGCPARQVTPEQLRRRDWWTGPRLFVLVDDYDLLAGARQPAAAADSVPGPGRGHRPARGADPGCRRRDAHVDGSVDPPAAGDEQPGRRAVLPTRRGSVAGQHQAEDSSGRAGDVVHPTWQSPDPDPLPRGRPGGDPRLTQRSIPRRPR